MQHFNKDFVWHIFIRLCFRNKIHNAIVDLSVCHIITTFEKNLRTCVFTYTVINIMSFCNKHKQQLCFELQVL